MNAQMSQSRQMGSAERHSLDVRMERVAWGLFLAMVGGLMLLPQRLAPEGAWLVGAGLIMLGLNGARYLSGIALSPFGVILGVLAVTAGLGAYYGIAIGLLPILLIAFGAGLVIRQFASGAE